MLACRSRLRFTPPRIRPVQQGPINANVDFGTLRSRRRKFEDVVNHHAGAVNAFSLFQAPSRNAAIMLYTLSTHRHASQLSCISIIVSRCSVCRCRCMPTVVHANCRVCRLSCMPLSCMAAMHANYRASQTSCTLLPCSSTTVAIVIHYKNRGAHEFPSRAGSFRGPVRNAQLNNLCFRGESHKAA